MSTAQQHFRTAAFGGFQKQDVLEYITAASKASQQQTEQLKQQAETALREREEMAGRLSAAEEARDKSAAEGERLRVQLRDSVSALDRAGLELEQLRAEHAKATRRLHELEERAPGLEADAAAYAALKDRTAAIEWEAHRSAEETVARAEAQAGRLRGELEGWLRRVQDAYQRLRTDVSATVQHLAGELEQCERALEEAAPAFRRHDEALAALLACEHSAAPKAPEPLPLEEEPEDGAGAQEPSAPGEGGAQDV